MEETSRPKKNSVKDPNLSYRNITKDGLKADKLIQSLIIISLTYIKRMTVPWMFCKRIWKNYISFEKMKN